MARSQSPDSANSQFFICFDDASFLDKQYTVWGKVIEGMENVDKIKRGEPVQNPDKMVGEGRRRREVRRLTRHKHATWLCWQGASDLCGACGAAAWPAAAGAHGNDMSALTRRRSSSCMRRPRWRSSPRHARRASGRFLLALSCRCRRDAVLGRPSPRARLGRAAVSMAARRSAADDDHRLAACRRPVSGCSPARTMRLGGADMRGKQEVSDGLVWSAGMVHR